MRSFLFLAGINGFLAVAAGAFAAHALKSRISERALEVFETGARYHLVHALALAAVALLVQHNVPLARGAGWCFLGGIVVFCGSLYALALSGVKLFGAVTPLGGLAFLAGWAMLAMAAWRLPSA